MLVPRLCRLHAPMIKIGWFLHSPFPTAEVQRRRYNTHPKSENTPAHSENT
jgi:hypothetical protein